MLLMAILIAAVGVAVVIPGCLILENDKSALALLIGALLITIGAIILAGFAVPALVTELMRS
jgi:hypothetical protein